MGRGVRRPRARDIPGGVGGTLHHVEVWVRDLEAAVASWGWLLERLGWVPYQRWECGRSWRLGGTYLVVEASPAVRGGAYDRRRQGGTIWRSMSRVSRSGRR